MSVFPQYRQPFYCRSMQYDELLGAGAHQGVVRLSVADGYAMVYDSGQDFSRWCLPSGVSGKGARRHQIFVYEGTDVITGFLDIHNTSEVLGGEMRGNASVYPEFYAVWTDPMLYLYGWPGGTGDFALSTTAGRLHKVTFKANQSPGLGGRYYDLTVSFSGKTWTIHPVHDTSEPWDTYTTYTYYLTATTASPVLQFYHSAGYQDHTVRITDISVKVVDTPDAWRGIKIFNAQCGGAQNWCGGISAIAGGFDYASQAGFPYKIIPLF